MSLARLFGPKSGVALPGARSPALCMLLGVAVIADRVRGSERLEAVLFVLRASGACGSAHGQRERGS